MGPDRKHTPDGWAARARALVQSGATASPSFREKALAALGAVLRKQRSAWERALHEDLGAPFFEAWATQTGLVLAEIRHARRRVRRWMRGERPATPLALFPARSRIEPAPLGAVLVIAPWNYPLQLTLAPAVAAIAAGNAVVIKPSEHAPATGRLLETLVPPALPPGLVEVVPGGPETARDLVAAGFDHIFFTGRRSVGRKVAEAAGRALTPVTLELGGKCPAWIDRRANFRVAARRLAWAKFLNAGQTCVAPDYVLVPDQRVEELTERIAGHIHRFYGADPDGSPDYARIVHRDHFDRLEGLLDGLPVRIGGERRPERLHFGPTVTGPWPEGHPAGKQEIFGPILPLVPYRRLAGALDVIRQQPDPLAAYAFSKRPEAIRAVRGAIRSGAFVVNDAVTQCANPGLPFGGVGGSGHGAYHGVHGFRRLTYPRALLAAGTWFDPPVRYPPYAGKAGLIRWLIR